MALSTPAQNPLGAASRIFSFERGILDLSLNAKKKCYRKVFNLSDISETGYGINKFTQFTILKVL